MQEEEMGKKYEHMMLTKFIVHDIKTILAWLITTLL